MKVDSLYRAQNFLSPESILYLYKATIRPCIEYCCHIWTGASADCLRLLDRIQRRITNIVGPDLSSNFQFLSHCRNVASLSSFYKYFHGSCSNELKSLTPTLKSFNRVTRYSANAHPFTVQLPYCNRQFYSTSFFPRPSDLWNSLPSSCFPPSYELQKFKCPSSSFNLTIGLHLLLL